MNKFMSTFTTGNVITLTFGFVGVVAAFFALTGSTNLNAEKITRLDQQLVQVEQRTDAKVQDIRTAISESEQRIQKQIERIGGKIDQILIQRR